MDDLSTLHDDHVFLRREALEHGYSDADLTAWVRAGVAVRIRQGAYVGAQTWAGADDLQRHRLRAHAVIRSHDARLVLSHTTAAVEHGLRLFKPDLTRVHVTCLDQPIARTTRDIVYHQGACGADQLMPVGEHSVVTPDRAALEAASLTTVAAGLVILDSAIDLGLASVDDLIRGHEAFTRWPNSRKLHITVRLTRPGAQSPGESLARYLMWTQHLPEPVLQFEVRDESGRLIGTTDFAWPDHGVLGEFDGLQKYGRLLRAGDTAADAVIREKLREDQLRLRTGWLMFRLVWAELFTPAVTGAKIRQQLERGRLLRSA